MTMCKCVSNRAEDLTDGLTLAPGQYAEVDIENPHNKTLLDEGRIVEVPREVTIPEETEVGEPAEATTQPGMVGEPGDERPDPDLHTQAAETTNSSSDDSEGDK